MASNQTAYQTFEKTLETIQATTSIDKFPKLSFVYGKSDFLLLRAASVIQATWLNFPAAECISQEGSELSLDVLETLYNQGSMFGANNLYMIRRAEQCKMLTDFFVKRKSTTSPKNHLCIIFRNEKSSEKLLAAIKKTDAFVLPCVEPAPFEYANYVDSLARRHQISFSSDARNLIIESLGKDMQRLANEVGRLALIFEATSKPLRSTDIAPYLGVLKEDYAVAVRNFLLSDKGPKAQALISDLIRRGESGLAILGIIAKHCRTALSFYDQTAKSNSSTSLPSYLSNQYKTYASSANLSKLKRGLHLCINADRTLKSSRTSEEVVLSEVVDSLS